MLIFGDEGLKFEQFVNNKNESNALEIQLVSFDWQFMESAVLTINK